MPHVGNVKNNIFHVFSMLKHHICAWNTGGEGIHSPRLFYLVRHLFYETAQMYAWEQIEARRTAMLRAPKLVHIQDFGTGQDRDELIMHIARQSVMQPRQAQLLARLLNYMNGNEYAQSTSPLTIVELGTSLGLTTAYMASVDSRNQIITFEGSQQVSEIAAMNWQKLHLSNITQKTGPIDDTLLSYAREEQPRIHFVLMDANHTQEATLRYFEWLLPLMDPNGIVVVDDIRYSKDMYAAWKTITHHDGVTATMDLGQMGLVFFYPNVQQRTYTIRL
ncbi:MAG: class I SAM-dependent methyltransferase [Paludibacteraceae bacterium]|nr:class I SAM-dependent methyltransferase [Paludibacteraceae bacterium]